METLYDLTGLCVFGVSTGFLLSLLMWAFGIVPRALRLFVK